MKNVLILSSILITSLMGNWIRVYDGKESDFEYEVTDVDTIPIQLLSNNGFEWEPGPDNPWIESNDSVGSKNIISNHYKGAEFAPPYQDSFMGYMFPTGLSPYDTTIVSLEQFLDEEIKFEEVDSLMFYMCWAPANPLYNLYRSCFIVVGEQDSLVINYFEPRDSRNNYHIINVHDTPPATIWTEQIFTNIAEKAEEFNISEQTIQSVLIQNLGRGHPSRYYTQKLGVDEIYLWGHRIEITRITEEELSLFEISLPPIQHGLFQFYYKTHLYTQYTLDIFDVTGRKVYSFSGILTPRSGQIYSTPSSIHKGIYFWRITTSLGESSGKFIYNE